MVYTIYVVPTNKKTTFRYKLFRSLWPSPISALICVGLGSLVVVGYLVSRSVEIGTSLPNLLDGEWGVAYTNHIVQPVATLTHSALVGKIATLFLWGTLGLVVYLVVEYSVYAYKGWRAAEDYIQITPYGYKKHVGLTSFLEVAAWRLCVVIIFAVIFVVGLLPMIQALDHTAPRVVLGQVPVAESAKQLIVLILGAGLVFHAIVVLLRLFLMRVRLFSDDPR